MNKATSKALDGAFLLFGIGLVVFAVITEELMVAEALLGLVFSIVSFNSLTN